MATVKTQDGKVLLKNGKVSCTCCGAPCNVIARSLCGTPDPLCGFLEFTCPESGTPETEGYQPAVEPSCPRKVYKTKTVHTVYSASGSYTNPTGCPAVDSEGNPTGGDPTADTDAYSYSRDTTETWEKELNEAEECVDSYTGSGESERVWNNGCGDREHENYTCSSTLTDGVWSSSCSGVGCGLHSDPFLPGYIGEHEDCSAVWAGPWAGMGPEGFGSGVWTSVSTVYTQTTKTETYIRSDSGTDSVSGWSYENEATHTITTTLSDEVANPAMDSLVNKICDERACSEWDGDSTCRYSNTPTCGTDEVSDQYGMSFLTYYGEYLNELRYQPEGCIVPGSATLTFKAESECPCEDIKQESNLSIVLRDLTPGNTYRATLKFLKCEFAKNEDEESEDYGKYLCPSCTTGVPCADGVDNADAGDQFIEFEATDWGEVLSDRLGQAEVEYTICVLKDEAHAWNLAHAAEIELEPTLERTVGSTSGSIDILEINHHYVWLDSCKVTEVTPPAP